MNTEHGSTDRVRIVMNDASGPVEVAQSSQSDALSVHEPPRAPEGPIRVVICDDHRLFVDALAAVLTSKGCEVVARTLHPDQAVAAVLANKVDVCMMDLSFPSSAGCDGLEGTRRVVAASPSTRVVMLTGSADSSVALPAIDAGARGFARKDDDLDRIFQTIKQVHAGEMVSASSATRRPWPAANPRRMTNQGQNLARFLTSREREVLERLVRGESTATLARAMEVSYHTARTHIQNVLAKLGVHSKLEAVAFAVNHSVVPVGAESSETAGAAPAERMAQA
ncbi:MAG TPA: response regulator transcription factor [Actinomycetota bacterium]